MHMTEQLQPIGSIDPQNKEQHQENQVVEDPVKADYKAGREFFRKGELAQAAMAYHNALRGFEEQGDEQGMANCSDRLGDVCVAREEYQLALELFQRAYAVCEKERDIFSMVSLNRKKAGIYKRLGELDMALELLFEIFDHYAQLRDPKGTVEILEVISEVYMEKGENGKAADTLRTIAGIHANFKHTRLAQQFTERAQMVEQG
jgi:tetratricopeptide (TPR) repeat protein